MVSESDNTDDKTIVVMVRGRVQRVGFRYSCRDKATELGVKGWVNNQQDGGVLVVASAPEETLDQFVEWLKIGPSLARVDSVDLAEGDDMEILWDDFRIG